MSRIMLLLFAIVTMVTFNCGEAEEPFFSHVYGWVKRTADSTGINDMNLKITDLDPDNFALGRERETTTTTYDSLDGFFEMDSVCYGTSQRQGAGYVRMIVADTDTFFPDLRGAIDTVELYISP